MNRKQKKAKQLRATAHTKHRHELNLSQVQPVVFNRQSAEAFLNQKDEFGIAVQNAGKSRLKSKICIIAYVLFSILLVRC